MNEVVNLISNVGFPIVITLIMFYYIENLTKEYMKTVNANINKLNEAIQDLTLTVNAIHARGEVYEDRQKTSKTLSNNQQTK